MNRTSPRLHPAQLNLSREGRKALAFRRAVQRHARVERERALVAALSSRARDFSEREISVTCCTMESELRVLVGAMSWR